MHLGARMDAATTLQPPLVKLAPVRPARRATLHAVHGDRRRETIRDTALRLDRARRNLPSLHEGEARRALLLWEGLVRGRLSLVDWFDADGRRFILLRPNGARARGGSGLTGREEQVAMGAALGESSKLTGYRLGISPSRVSTLLRAAMRKLDVRTKAQLVVMVRVLVSQARSVCARNG
jgi:DNA-binding CsgD family transcriptional regulator